MNRLMGVKKVPCSCSCGGNRAWVIVLDGGIQVMYGCVCHHPEPNIRSILITLDGIGRGNDLYSTSMDIDELSIVNNPNLFEDNFIGPTDY